MNITLNCSLNSSDTSHGYTPEVITYIVLEVIIAVLAFGGNGMVLMAVWRFRSLSKSPTNWFVASLAVADIAVAIFAIPSAILLRLGLSVSHSDCPCTVEGPSVGEVTCLLIITSVLFLTQVSIFSLTVIAIDRFIAINYPFKYQSLMTSKKLLKISVATVWILGALIGMVPQLGWNQWVMGDSDKCEHRQCAFEKVTSMEYMVYFNFFGCVLLPLLVMGVMYIIIFRSAKRQLRKIYFDVKNLKSRSRSTEFLNHFKISTSDISNNANLRKKSRAQSPSRNEVTNMLRPDPDVRLKDQTESSKLRDPNFLSPEDDHRHSRSRHSRSSISESDMRELGKVDINESNRRKSSSFSALSSLHPHSAIELNNFNGSRITTFPNSHSRTTVCTTDFGSEMAMKKSSSNSLNNNELRRKMKRRKQLLKKEFRAARSLATVVCVFAFCWLPLHITNCFTLLCHECEPVLWFIDLAILLSHANSMVNPMIYAFGLRDYRNAFRKLLSCVFVTSSTTSVALCCSSSINEPGSPDLSSDDRSKDLSHVDKRNNNFNNSNGTPRERYIRNKNEISPPLLAKTPQKAPDNPEEVRHPLGVKIMSENSSHVGAAVKESQECIRTVACSAGLTHAMENGMLLSRETIL